MPCNLSGVYPPALTSEPMKNSTVNKGNNRSKINSVGVGQPSTRRNNAIVKSIVKPPSNPARKPQMTVLRKGSRRLEADEELFIDIGSAPKPYTKDNKDPLRKSEFGPIYSSRSTIHGK